MELELARGLVPVLRRRLSGLMLRVGDGDCSGWYWIERVGRVCAVPGRGECIAVLRRWLSGRRPLVDRGGEEL